MTLDNVRAALYSWMQRETGLEIIRPEQSEHRPDNPYGTVKFLNPAQRLGGQDELRYKEGGFVTAGSRLATASLNLFGEGANDLMSALRDSLDRPDVIEEFSAAGIAHVGEEGPNDLTGLEETNYRERSQMDLMLQFAVERSTPVTNIESVELEYEDTEHAGDLDQTVIVASDEAEED